MKYKIGDKVELVHLTEEQFYTIHKNAEYEEKELGEYLDINNDIILKYGISVVTITSIKSNEIMCYHAHEVRTSFHESELKLKLKKQKLYNK